MAPWSPGPFISTSPAVLELLPQLGEFHQISEFREYPTWAAISRELLNIFFIALGSVFYK